MKKDNTVLPATRWVAALVIPFLVAAFVILYILPAQTAKLFAWEIKPPMTAMMLGAAYAGGIYFFAGVLLTKEWHRIKVGFLPVTTFASMLGIATILHWDKFNHHHISFFAWAALYFTAPFIVFYIWFQNRNHDSGAPIAGDPSIGQTLRLIIGITGLTTLIISIILFLQPKLMITLWPWTLTPLTARVMGAMFSLPGMVGLGMAMESRWSSAKVILQSQGFSILLILIAAARDWNSFDQSKPSAWLFTGGLGAMLVGIVLLFIYFNAQKVTTQTVSSS
jgi:hypothetical protein